MHFKHAITIRGERAEIEGRWREQLGDTVWVRGADVRFVDAPGDRGTEIHVCFEHSALKDALGKFTGDSAGDTAKDDLRHFKQIVETGEVVRSEATPEGQRAGRALKQDPAQPREEAVR